jgi:signal peptidase II
VRHLKSIALVMIVLVGCVGCDQATESLATEHLQGHGVVSLLDGTLRLQYAENPGGFLSLGASLPARWRTTVFTVGAAGLVAGMLSYAFFALDSAWQTIVALSLICGGGIGNLIDRLRHHGYVVDFLNIGIGSLRTGIFNVADVALMTGFAMIIIQQSLTRRPVDHRHRQ